MIGPKELRHSLSTNQMQNYNQSRLGDPRFPREVGWFFTLSSHWLINVFSFLLSGFCDNFGFGITILDRKAFYNFSGPTSFYQDKSKPHYNSLNVIVDNFLTLSSVMGSIKKYHWDHEQDKNRYKLSQKRSKGVISLRYTN